MTTRAAIFLTLLALLLVAGCSEEALRQQEADRDPATEQMLGDLPTVRPNAANLVAGQTIYVPAYPQLVADAERRLPLSVSLLVHNTDAVHPIVVRSVRYYASDGTLLQDLLPDGPVELAPMSTATHLVARPDHSGGGGANFLVEWGSPARVAKPLVETIMVSDGAGLAFTSRGQVIDER
jgi:hypothetical protein